MNRITKKLLVCFMSGTIAVSPLAIMSENTVIVSEAHSGRTDSSGGHHDNKNASGLGSYHYHCNGNPPHLHDGGVCPYAPSVSSSTSAISDASAAVSSESTGSSVSSVTSTAGKSLKLSTGSEVALSKDLIKIVQDVLNQKGYECGTPDGIIGTKTQNAIVEYLDDSNDSDTTDYIIIQLIADALSIS